MTELRRSDRREENGCNYYGLDFQVTTRDTLDLNGDGIADFIDAGNFHPTTNRNWRVYLGSPNAGGTGVWGFSAGVNWSAPLGAIGKIGYDLEILGNPGTTSVVELRDWNGDGLPDLIESWPGNCATEGQQVQWKVWYNTGTGFEANARVKNAPVGAISFTRASWNDEPGPLELGTFDVNGDGLADYV